MHFSEPLGATKVTPNLKVSFVLQSRFIIIEIYKPWVYNYLNFQTH